MGTGDAAQGSNPQDDSSLGGKVLRIDRDGAPALGNPGGYRWFSKGHRNVQGIAFRSSDDLGVSAEHGPSVDDEINLLVAGNFGWDPVPGYTESVPMTDLGEVSRRGRGDLVDRRAYARALRRRLRRRHPLGRLGRRPRRRDLEGTNTFTFTS